MTKPQHQPLAAQTRFSDRVDNYIKYRPSYPADVLALIAERCHGTQPCIADIGSGTGILSTLLLERGYRVHGIEPNDAMRQAAEILLQEDIASGRFMSHNASAEKTGLPDNSVDLIVAGQAFHWFDREKARIEWQRILRPGGRVMLIWNDRRTEGTAFLIGYEALLHTHGTDYATVNHKHIDDDVIGAFFAPHKAQKTRFDNVQLFDFDGLKGRLLSSSYTPSPEDPRHAPMLQALQTLFDDTHEDGYVHFTYDTVVYDGLMYEVTGA